MSPATSHTIVVCTSYSNVQLLLHRSEIVKACEHEHHGDPSLRSAACISHDRSFPVVSGVAISSYEMTIVASCCTSCSNASHEIMHDDTLLFIDRRICRCAMDACVSGDCSVPHDACMR